MRSFRKRGKEEGGVALMLVVILLTTVTFIVVITLVPPLLRMFQNTQMITTSNDTYLISEASSDDILYRLTQIMNIAGEQTIEIGNKVATTTYVMVDFDTRSIETVASTEGHVRSTQIVVSANVADIDIQYGATIGDGGVSMNNNSEITGVIGATGSLYSNSNVNGNAGEVITGDLYVATDVYLDNAASSTVCDSDREVGRVSPHIDHAQSFIPSASDSLNSIVINVKKQLNPSSIPVYIVADDLGKPDTAILSSGTLDRNKVSSTYAWTYVPLMPTIPLVAGQTYWIVLDAGVQSQNYWLWCEDSAGGYIGGSSAESDDYSSDPWAALPGDLAFKIALGSGSSVIHDVEVEGDAWALSIEDSYVWGDAYYESITGTTVVGTEYPNSGAPPVVSMPVEDDTIDSWKFAASSGGVISGSCPGTAGCSSTMGPIKIDGDWNIAVGEIVTITGAIYVTGNLTADNNVVISCDASYGTESCVVVVDGHINFTNNVAVSGSGDPESFAIFTSLIDTCVGGTQLPECAPENSAIHLYNNVVGGVYLAPYGLVHMNNNANVQSVASDSLSMDNGSAITYDPHLQDLSVVSIVGHLWNINMWREIE